MASAIAPTFLSFSQRRPFLLSSHPPTLLDPKITRFYPAVSVALSSSSSWCGLKHFSAPSRRNFFNKGRKGRFRGPGVYASLFGVGAPEALVIGVVALLVFGPKGLAEVARNLGKTLRAFQPTIKELQDVSREFKSTLEREIGLDEIASSTNNSYKPTFPFGNENQQSTVDPNGATTSKPYSSDELLKITEQQLAATAAQSQAEAAASSPEELPQAAPTTSEVAPSPMASEMSAAPPPKPDAQKPSEEKA